MTDESDILPASVFVADNKKALLKLMERESAGSAAASAQYKMISKWVGGHNAIKVFLSANRKELLKLVNREAAGAARQAPEFKRTTRWMEYFGKKWYFAYLF